MCLCIDLSGLKTQDKTRMDAKKKEMDLLSNSIAAYAHIKGLFLLIIKSSINSLFHFINQYTLSYNMYIFSPFR